MNARGILLVAHGSILPGAEGDVEQLAAFLKKATGVLSVEIGYLDYTTPSIQDAVKVCLARGLTDLLVVPYFLTDGYLCKKALRQVREALRGTQVDVQEAKPLGGAPELVDAMLDAAARAERRLR
ncbi:sirohydrochlorin cobaltochelatase [Tumebacillus sp. BK434]|uniref:sirohydrochlorin chelatase n=1 Tax=Tumebacillus sp. BK434 TaxID=2512169 RepID=UPI0010E505F4|nr:CbiX/SirB N-terminal domain-containing protein [Tumebacillus sp. BK434]TCP55997.1 sirohydrochlorin cobaltochelatase [Tumebacillus sp. BK434]